ncbi:MULTISPECIES: hypothetical protein [Haloferacaceae]|uniref:Uncharacterized protein n=1 Tax=Halorubrum glutamatedens TaxID=2707018 RepID=A0ABD5QTC3_9EURY|nr:hypothetical protein [Halobellus captivus]
MRATILALVHGDVADPHIESRLEPSTYPAIDATAYEGLDGGAIYAGTAAAELDRERPAVYVTDSGIHTEDVESELITETVVTEWIGDLSTDDDTGWLGVDSSDGDWLFEALGGAKGVEILRSRIDVDAFGAYVADYPTADAWNVTQSREFDQDGDSEEATIDYHDAAQLGDVRNAADTSMLGFRYHWGDRYVRGVVAASGYVAVFDGPDAPKAYAEFINSEILPFASLPEEYQGTFADVPEETEGEADV